MGILYYTLIVPLLCAFSSADTSLSTSPSSDSHQQQCILNDTLSENEASRPWVTLAQHRAQAVRRHAGSKKKNALIVDPGQLNALFTAAQRSAAPELEEKVLVHRKLWVGHLWEPAEALEEQWQPLPGQRIPYSELTSLDQKNIKATVAERICKDLSGLIRSLQMDSIQQFDRLRNYMLAPTDGRERLFTEGGMHLAYLTIQSTRNSTIMLKYIRMLLLASGASEPDTEKLNELGQFYRGDEKMLNWIGLWRELDARNLLPKGEQAALTEPGYIAVSMTKDNAEMKAFATRVIRREGCRVINQAGLTGFAMFYSGILSSQSLQAMIDEIPKKAERERWWIQREGPPNKEIMNMVLHLDYGKAKASERVLSEMVVSVNRAVSSVIHFYRSVRIDLINNGILNGTEDFHSEVGEFGYQAVQGLRSTPLMQQFIGLLLQSAGGSEISSNPDFPRFASLFSGEVSSLSWSELWVGLQERGWLPKGDEAAFTESGYTSVASSRRGSEMHTYIRRLQSAHCPECTIPEVVVNEMVAQHSGDRGTQSLASLQKQLRTYIRRGAPGSLIYARPPVTSRATGDLLQSVTDTLPTVLLEPPEVSDHVAGDMVSAMAKAVETVVESSHRLTERATHFGQEPAVAVDLFNNFNRFGFSGVQALKNDQALSLLIRLAVQSAGGSIPEEELSNIVSKYRVASGETHWEKLWADLGAHGWLPGCGGVAFTESGYNAIAIRQNNAEMKCFIKKFIQSCGGYVKSEPDLESMVPFHSGERTVQSFLSLKNELVAHASKKDAWLVLPSLVYKGWETETMADILSSEMFTTLRSLATLATESFMVTHATLSSAASTPPSRDSLVRHASNLGYEAVQAARNNTAMVEFIEFLVAGAGGDIVDPSQLRIVADRYSGIREERTWDRLWEDLQDMRWLPNGILLPSQR